jgi:heme oxygenase
VILLMLKQQTKDRHEALERRLAPLLGPLAPYDYCRLLQAFYGFYLPIEQRLAAVPGWEALGLDIEQRRKAPRLAADLRYQGMPDAALGDLPLCERLPELATLTQALGCAYVLEGATLGGQIITRHLRQQLGLDERRGGAFFGSYGNAVGPMWRAFQAALRAHCADPSNAAPLVRSANDTFVALEQWLFGGEGQVWPVQLSVSAQSLS